MDNDFNDNKDDLKYLSNLYTNIPAHSEKTGLFSRNKDTVLAGFGEYYNFPVRNLYFNNHGVIPNEWSSFNYFSGTFIKEYFEKNKANIVSVQYQDELKVSSALIYLGGKENIYINIMASLHKEYYDNNRIVVFFNELTKNVVDLIEYFNKSSIPAEATKLNGKLHILVPSGSNFALKEIKIPCPEIDFDLNYNSDFKEINNLIERKLNDSDTGIILLHGEAGTGKTTYIRYLMNQLNKRVIYIPPNLINFISTPEYLSFFMNYTDSILVIEEAENILGKRGGQNSNQAVSNLLNMGDGLLGDCLRIKIIATFNTDLKSIDDALLRKGRLLAKYEFKKLSSDRVSKLALKLNKSMDSEDTLANIYNADEKSFVTTRNKIGF